jgi:putative acetyltransferase
MNSAQQIKIRRALADDAQLLFQAERETSKTPGLLVSHPDELCESAFCEKITWLSTAGIYLVAEIAGSPAGHALLEPSPQRAMSHVFSLTIVVHKNHTRRGIGTALMTHLIDYAKGNPAIEKIELRVRASNLAAQRLYSRFGFVEEGRFQKRIKLNDGSYIADICMATFV